MSPDLFVATCARTPRAHHAHLQLELQVLLRRELVGLDEEVEGVVEN